MLSEAIPFSDFFITIKKSHCLMVCGFGTCLHFIIALTALLCIYEYSRKSRAEVGLLTCWSLFTFNLNEPPLKQRKVSNFKTLMNKKNAIMLCLVYLVLMCNTMEVLLCRFNARRLFFFLNNLCHLYSVWDTIIHCLQTSDNIIMHFCPLFILYKSDKYPFY